MNYENLSYYGGLLFRTMYTVHIFVIPVETTQLPLRGVTWRAASVGTWNEKQ